MFSFQSSNILQFFHGCLQPLRNSSARPDGGALAHRFHLQAASPRPALAHAIHFCNSPLARLLLQLANPRDALVGRHDSAATRVRRSRSHQPLNRQQPDQLLHRLRHPLPSHRYPRRHKHQKHSPSCATQHRRQCADCQHRRRNRSELAGGHRRDNRCHEPR